MEWLWWSAAIVGGQAFAAALVAPPAAGRPRSARSVARARLGRLTRRIAPAGVVAAAVALVARAPGATPDATLTLAVVAGAASAAGVAGLLRSGALERAGRVAPARRLVREAGRLAAAGAIATLAVPPLAGASGAAARGVAAAATVQLAAALLAGLSRKPRPAAGVAAVAWLAAAVLLGRLAAG